MKFLSTFTVPQSQLAPPTPEGMAAMGQLVEDSIAAGELIATGMYPFPGTAFRVLQQGGECVVTDIAPDPGAVRCGWALLEAKTREDAVRMTKRFLSSAGQGTCQVFEVRVAAARVEELVDMDLRHPRAEANA